MNLITCPEYFESGWTNYLTLFNPFEVLVSDEKIFFFKKKKFENCKKYLIQKIEKKNIKIYKKYSIYTKNIANFNQKNNSFPF
jgi:hypothetical protein